VAVPGWRPGKGRGRLVHDPGGVWPWPRRPGSWGAEDPGRERRISPGSVTRASREGRATATEVGPRHREAEDVTLPPVFFRRCNHVTVVLGPCRGPDARSAFPALDLGLLRAGKCDVPGIFVTDRAALTSLSGETITEVRLRADPVPSPPRTPQVPGVSWRPHPAGVATRRPGRTSDGHRRRERRRPPPRPRQSRPQTIQSRPRPRQAAKFPPTPQTLPTSSRERTHL
jgi:hypothetical protein